MRIRRTITAALLLASLLVTGACNENRLNPFTDTVPEFSVIMNNGETVNTFTLFGAPAVICTFNTSDSRSMKALSLLQSVYGQYRRTVKFVTISDGEPEEDVILCWSLHDYALPYSAQEDGTQAGKFSKSVPYILIVNGNMNIIGSYDGDSLPTRSELERLLTESTK